MAPTKQVNSTLPRDLFNAVVAVKELHGMTWPEFIVYSAQKMDDQGVMQQHLNKPVEQYFENNNSQ